MTPKAVRKARRQLHAKGFRGRAGKELARATDAPRNHHIRVAEYAFSDGLGGTIREPYVEAWEMHDAQKRVRILRLADLVHIVQNLTPDELMHVAGRKKPSR